MQMPTAKSAGNTTWWTDPTIPDPADLPTVRGWRILVRPIPNAPKTKGGIIIPMPPSRRWISFAASGR
jgi:hypothetical protein